MEEVEKEKGDLGAKKSGWSLVVQRAAKERDGEALLSYYYWTSCLLLGDEACNTGMSYRYHCAGGDVDAIPALHNLRAQALLGGAYALRHSSSSSSSLQYEPHRSVSAPVCSQSACTATTTNIFSLATCWTCSRADFMASQPYY